LIPRAIGDSRDDNHTGVSVKLFHCLSLLAAAALIASPALSAEDPSLIARPVFGQIVSLPLPDGFRVAFHDENAVSYILESVPAGETVDAWNEMITVTASKFPDGNARPLDNSASALADHYWQACNSTFKGISLGAAVVDGHEALTTFMGCGTVKTPQGDVSETAVIVFLKGRTATYSVQWARHANAQASPIGYEAEDWGDRLATLSRIRLCDPAGEEAPYPSCR
jgi:hypothetical protein